MKTDWPFVTVTTIGVLACGFILFCLVLALRSCGQ
jgi:hypothetical protein